MVDSLPTPRFTQRDILDNRTLHPHYHYHHQSLLSSSFMNNKQRRHSHHLHQLKHHPHLHHINKKAKLIRSHSTPITIDHQLHHTSSPSYQQHKTIHRQHSAHLSSQHHHHHHTTTTIDNNNNNNDNDNHEDEDGDDFFSLSSSSSSLTSTPSPTSSPQRKRKRITHIPLSPPIDESIINNTIDHPKKPSINTNTIITPSSPPSSQQRQHEEEEIIGKKQHEQKHDQSLISSLDCLSYAAESITKSFLYHQQLNNDNNDNNDNDDNDDNDDDNDDDHSSLKMQDHNYSSTSSITAAAEAMMMFGKHTQK
ncbi:unnamed protein product [Cunninghamella blakesleeana]